MKKCIICDEAVVEQSFTSRNNKNLQLFCCSNCGHCAQAIEDYSDIYSDGTFTKIARAESDRFPSKNKIEELDRRAFKRFRYYKSIINKNSRGIDVGSSIGSFVHLLRLYGCYADGLEPDPDYCRFSEQQYGFEQYNLLMEDFVPSEPYDIVFSFHVIEHVEDPHSFVARIKSILKNEGTLVLQCPSMEIKSFGNIQQTIWEPHIHYFNAASMYFLLSAYFSDIEIGYYEEGLTVIAKNAEVAGFDGKVLERYKRQARFVSSMVEGFPRLKWNNHLRKLRDLAIQSILEKGAVKERLSKGIRLGHYKIKEYNYLKNERGNGKDRIVHITNYKGWGNNAGDIVLSSCVRSAISNDKQTNDLGFNIHSLGEKVNQQLINEINRSKFLLIGGGGLFLPDTNQNSVSGWQWAVSKQQLDEIHVPVVLYAIGYNYFPGQTPNNLFVENLNHIIGKSDFVGIRNTGSIESVKGLLSSDIDVNKIHFQPCPTTLIRKLVKGLGPKTTSRNVAVNIAFDRYEKRFGDKIYQILYQITKALKRLEERSYNIYNVCHLAIDEKAEIVFDRVGLNYKTVRLHHMLPNDIYSFYNNMEVVMGMRGHAQMIPFGINTKIITLGTHDKMKWFLEDINMLDVYIDVNSSEDLCAEILEKFEYTVSESDQIHDRIITEQEKLFEVTAMNLEVISGLI